MGTRWRAVRIILPLLVAITGVCAQTPQYGALPAKTKEMLGLASSMVLRCNDCIDYHLEQCVAAGYSREEIVDGMNVALVVGGSIVIPHLRHALITLDELLEQNGNND